MVIDSHLGKETIEDLARYINNKVPKGIDLHLTVLADENAIVGHINNSRFKIEFESGKRMKLTLGYNIGENEKRLMNILSPVMWHVDKSIERDDIVFAPILKYTDNQTARKIIQWEYENPEKCLRSFAIETFRYGLDANDIEITYKDKDLDSLCDEIKFGKYTDVFSKEELEKIDKYTEIELFVALDNLENRIKDICDAVQKDYSFDALYKRTIDLSYRLAYLKQQAKRFGVDVKEPTFNIEVQSADFIAWFNWWHENIKKIYKENPNIKSQLFKEEHNVVIRPEGSYKDFLDETEPQN